MGSLFLGYCVGFMALLIHNFNLNFSAFWAIIAITPFFFDSTITLIIRMFCGQNILTAHRWHAFQKLADLTKSHTIATLVYTAWQVAFSWVVLAAAKDDFSNSSAKPALALFVGFAVFYCSVLWLAKKSNKSTAPRC